MRVHIKIDGLFNIGATAMTWLGCSAHAIEKTKPVLSDTGYRSFLGVDGGALEPGLTPDAFVKAIITAIIQRGLSGKLKKIVPLRP